MRDNKGFTLIEIIGTVIILGILAIIAVPFFTRSMEDFRIDFYSNMEDNLKSSGREFFSDNRNYRPTHYLEAKTVSLNTLMGQKYIDDIVDYEGNECNKNSYVIIIKRGRDDYDYHVCLKCEFDDYDNTVGNNYCDSSWSDSTNISFGLGEPETIYVYKGTPRDELKEKLTIPAWIIRVDDFGNEIDRVNGLGEEGVPTIYPTNLDTIDADTVGEYESIYEYNGKTETGKVVVYENSGPDIDIKKVNVVKTGGANTTGSTTETTTYTSGEWAQKLVITLGKGDGMFEELGSTIAKYQWKRGNKWLDFCTPSSGDSCVITRSEEMNETVYFRTVDSLGNVSGESIAYTLRIDNTAPSCELTKSGTIGSNSWYTTNVAISFNSTGTKDNLTTVANNVSGINKRVITTGSIGTTSVTSGTQSADTSSVTWYGYVEDMAQNYAVCNTNFKKDATDPNCTDSGDSTTWTNANRTINYGCSDSTSGCDGAYDGGSKVFSTTTKTSTMSSYTIKDNAGNTVTCSSRTADVYVDKTPPVCTNSGDSTTWQNSSRTINYGCSDDDSGCASGYSGGSKTFSTSTTTTTISSYTIKDVAGNTVTCSSRTASVYVDVNSPSCSFTYSTTEWTNQPVGVTFNAKDSGGSTIEYYTYTLGGQTTRAEVWRNDISSNLSWTNTNGPIPFRVYDAAGNSGSCNLSISNVDQTKPSCSISLSATGWTNGNVTATISGTDDLSGIAGYTFDSTAGYSSTTTTTLSSESTNNIGRVVTGFVKDKAGNVSDLCAATYKIDKTAPSISCEKSNTGTTSGVTITCTCSDGTSGVKTCAGQSGSSATITGVTSSKTYYAVDNAGNSSSGASISVSSSTQKRKCTKATWSSGSTESDLSSCSAQSESSANSNLWNYVITCSSYTEYGGTFTLSGCGTGGGVIAGKRNCTADIHTDSQIENAYCPPCSDWDNNCTTSTKYKKTTKSRTGCSTWGSWSSSTSCDVASNKCESRTVYN